MWLLEISIVIVSPGDIAKQMKMVKLLRIGRMQIRCHSYMMKSSPTPLTAVGGEEEEEEEERLFGKINVHYA